MEGGKVGVTNAKYGVYFLALYESHRPPFFKNQIS
jgi:hypothetical protein